jgi:D-arginine dehydrogenase
LVEAAPPVGVDVRSWPIVKAADDGGYLRPAGRNVWASGCEEETSPPCDAQPDDLAVAVAWDRLTLLTGRTGWTPLARWAGLRTFAPDRSPVVGWDEGAEGLFWVAGLGGAGVQCAPAIGRCAAALIARDALPGDITALGPTARALSPGRFSAPCL